MDRYMRKIYEYLLKTDKSEAYKLLAAIEYPDTVRKGIPFTDRDAEEQKRLLEAEKIESKYRKIGISLPIKFHYS